MCAFVSHTVTTGYMCPYSDKWKRQVAMLFEFKQALSLESVCVCDNKSGFGYLQAGR